MFKTSTNWLFLDSFEYILKNNQYEVIYCKYMGSEVPFFYGTNMVFIHNKLL